MSARFISAAAFVLSTYGGVWAARYCSDLVPLFAFDMVLSAWTVNEIWNHFSD